MRKRVVILGLIASVLAAAAAVALWVVHVPDLVRIGTGYTAEQTCACLFVSRRPLASCWMDLDPLARRLMSVHPAPAVERRLRRYSHAQPRTSRSWGPRTTPRTALIAPAYLTMAWTLRASPQERHVLPSFWLRGQADLAILASCMRQCTAKEVT